MESNDPVQHRARRVERQVRLGVLGVATYGGVLVLEGLIVGLREGWIDVRHLAAHVGGGILWLLLAWAVYRRVRWAWIASISLGAIFLFVGTAALLLVFRGGGEAIEGVERSLRVGRAWIPLAVLSILGMASTVLCLGTSPARQAFQRTDRRLDVEE